MACALTQNITLDCRQSVGGIKSIFVTELANIESVTATGGTTQSIEMEDGSQFRQYDFRKQTGTFTETITASEENGTVFYAPEIVVQFSKLEVNKRNEIQLLAQNELAIIVLDNNGSYWLTGVRNGLSITAGTAATGQAFGDLNGYSLTFTGGEPEPMLQVPAGQIPALLTPAA